MIPLGILASSVSDASEPLLAPTNLVATLVEPAPTPLPTVIGEAFGGGFYAGDIESDGVWYKLILADVSAEVYRFMWKTVLSTTVGTDHMSDGMSNTTSMIAAGINQHPVAEHCISHRGGGHSDWYMPAKDELNIIYENLGVNRPGIPPDFMEGGPQAFALTSFYWSSTEAVFSDGWTQQLGSGLQDPRRKDFNGCRVRPVRRIPFSP